MNVKAKTDIGVKRHSNQDDYAVLELPDNSFLIAVCDGMGGANAGNVASQTACKVIASFFERSYRRGLDAQGITALLQGAILSANIEIFGMSAKSDELKGMGTTVVAAYVSTEICVVSHVGDSRAYIVNQSITQLTRDHSVVQSLIESGRLTPEEASVHPRRNVITRALGIEPEVLVDSDEHFLADDDILMLCSDGLSNFINDGQLKDIFATAKFEDLAQSLVDKANKNGGGDNITVVLLKKG